MTGGLEKREAHRVPLDAKISYSPDGVTWRETRSKDVSSTGMQLLTQEQVDRGAVIRLNFNLPNLRYHGSIAAEAEVVRVINQRGNQTGLGLRFISLQASQYEVVEEFVSRVLGLNVGPDFEQLGTKKSGGYAYSMDRLARESEARKAEELEKKVMAQEAQAKKQERRDILLKLGKAVLLAAAGYAAYQITTFFIAMIFKLSELAP